MRLTISERRNERTLFGFCGILNNRKDAEKQHAKVHCYDKLSFCSKHLQEALLIFTFVKSVYVLRIIKCQSFRRWQVTNEKVIQYAV